VSEWGWFLSEAAVLHMEVWLAQSWATFSCTVRLTSGWQEHILTSHGVGIRMTGWCTVVLNEKQKPSRWCFKPGWRSASALHHKYGLVRLLPRISSLPWANS